MLCSHCSMARFPDLAAAMQTSSSHQSRGSREAARSLITASKSPASATVTSQSSRHGHGGSCNISHTRASTLQAAASVTSNSLVATWGLDRKCLKMLSILHRHSVLLLS